MDPDRYTAWDEVEIPRGRIRLSQRVPAALRRARGAPDWYGVALDPGMEIGEVLITPAGRVDITAKAPTAYEIEEEGSPPPPAAVKARAVDAAGPAAGVMTEDVQEAFKLDLEAAKRYAEASKAESTLRAYTGDWTRFKDWCRRRDLDALPASPDTAAVFLASEARQGLKPSTLERRLSAIRFFHEVAGERPPQAAPGMSLKAVMSGIRREEGTKPRQARALTVELIKRLVDEVDLVTMHGIRDMAILLLGFGAALRRSELVALEVGDLTFSDGGVAIEIRRSKTDQEGEGRRVLVPRGGPPCPVAALEDWIAEAKLEKGPLFRRTSKSGRVLDQGLTGETIRLLIKQYAFEAGLDSRQFSAHSLRRGWLTAASRRMVETGQVDLKALMAQAGHANERTVLGYIEEAEDFKDHPGKGLL